MPRHYIPRRKQRRAARIRAVPGIYICKNFSPREASTWFEMSEKTHSRGRFATLNRQRQRPQYLLVVIPGRICTVGNNDHDRTEPGHLIERLEVIGGFEDLGCHKAL
jgi:hypothetical protein